MPEKLPAIAALLLAWTLATPAAAAGWQDYAGAWTITGVQPAPWADASHPPEASEARRLIGRQVTFSAQRVAGPSPLGCAKPVYKVDVVGPDMIFEGMLAEKAGGQAGGAAGANASAVRLGFADPQKIATLDAGCTEVQFHALRPGALVFGLNNQVYTMVRK